MMFNDDNNNGNNGNRGNRGKFSDRLKKMRRDRLKRRKNVNIDSEEENVVKYGGRNILKVLLAIPSVVYTNINFGKKKDVISLDKNVGEKSTKRDETSSVSEENIEINDEILRKRFKISKIRDIDVTLLKKKRELYAKQAAGRSNYVNKETGDTIETELKIQKLQKEIIDLIKKRLVKNINELEVLQSELYVLKEIDGDSVFLDDCQENIKEIKKLLSKVKALKEKYDYLKDNVDFEYMLEYGDDFLIDKILELKDLCSRDDISYVVDNYKILDEYKFLYLKIDKLNEDTIKLEEVRDKKVEDLKERDIDFDKLKSEVYDVDKENDRYNSFVKRQELFLRDLEEKISRVDSHEEVMYKLKGFNQLLGNSFKYLGLLLVNPLKGLIPGIATQTLVTKNVIRNLYQNLEWKANKKMVYEAIDYSDSIKIAINNLDDTSHLVDSTLEEIVRLKSKYQSEFSRYENEIPGYKDAIKKINKIENAILGNKIKMELMRQRMKEKERQNSNKLKMVKKLNSSQNS